MFSATFRKLYGRLGQPPISTFLVRSGPHSSLACAGSVGSFHMAHSESRCFLTTASPGFTGASHSGNQASSEHVSVDGSDTKGGPSGVPKNSPHDFYRAPIPSKGPSGASKVNQGDGVKRENWEYIPTAEHKSLVLLFYRNILKGLMNYKSIRRRSMIAYARFCFRRRATATEKLLIDECIEEARRAIYVLEKHHNFTKTGTYEFDIMGLPKDTGQDVKTFMEEHYDPEYSRQQFQHFQDVQPGREHLHNQKGLGPTSGAHHWKDQTSSSGFKVEIRDEDKAMRPPPPPMTD